MEQKKTKDKTEGEKEKKQENKEGKKLTDKEIISDLTDTLQRTQAEFENYKKRVDKEKVEFVKYAKAELVQRKEYLFPAMNWLID